MRRSWLLTPLCLLALAALPARAHTGAADAAPELIMPVTPACISSPFGPRILPNHPQAGTFHNGVDLPAPEGTPVRAVAPGTVVRVQRHGPGGLEILLQHNGFMAIYSHLGSVAPLIAEGKRTVYGGEKLGVVGHTGVTFGMHLFFGVVKDGRFVDPAPILRVSQCGVTQRRKQDMLTASGQIPPTRVYGLIQPGYPPHVRSASARPLEEALAPDR
jgi:murein DD-endopeptidase MepM/ murein hydrolase activator NlpD